MERRQTAVDIIHQFIEGRGKVVVTFQALGRALGFPEDAEIYGVEMSPNDLSKSQFVIFVKHADLPTWCEGAEIPQVPPGNKD